MRDHRHSWLSFGRDRANARGKRIEMLGSRSEEERKSYNGCRQVEGIVSQFISDLELEVIALSSVIIWNGNIERAPQVPPCVP